MVVVGTHVDNAVRHRGNRHHHFAGGEAPQFVAGGGVQRINPVIVGTDVHHAVRHRGRRAHPSLGGVTPQAEFVIRCRSTWRRSAFHGCQLGCAGEEAEGQRVERFNLIRRRTREGRGDQYRNIGAIQQFAYAGLVLLGQLDLLPHLGEEVEPVQHGSGVRSQALEHRNLPVLGVALAADRAAQRRCQTLLSQFVPEAGLFRLGQRVEYVRPERVRTGCGQRGFHFRRDLVRRGRIGGIDHQLRGRSRVGRRSGCIGGSLRLARGLDALHGGLNGSRNVRLRRGRSLRPVVVEQSATQREPAQ